jgi:hypothetical protein
MLPSEQFVLHVGLSKTGTTTLQQFIFPKHPEILYLGKDRTLQTPMECTNEFAFKILNPLLWNHKLALDLAQLTRSKEEFKQTQKTKDGLWLASWEELGSRPQRLNLESIRRIKKGFGTCRLLVFLRNPFQRIPSEYLQSLRYNYLTLGKRSRGLRSLLQPLYLDLEQWLSKEQSSGYLEILLGASDLIRGSMEIVGKENIGVFLFEEFRNNPQQSIRSVCDFLCVDPQQAIDMLDNEETHLNARMTQGQVEYLQSLQKSPWKRLAGYWKNHRARRLLYRQHGGDQQLAKPQLSDQWKGRISDSTREGHRWLSETFGLNMEQHGYPL